jgi:PTH1 family peptidyl-tRNA hydrolase
MYKLIVGLGNPGKEYAQTRHNVGFLALEAFASAADFPAFKNKEKFRGDISEKGSGDKKQILIMPDTFMNLKRSKRFAAKRILQDYSRRNPHHPRRTRL